MVTNKCSCQWGHDSSQSFVTLVKSTNKVSFRIIFSNKRMEDGWKFDIRTYGQMNEENIFAVKPECCVKFD
jgi:hypothetical protein